MEIQQLKSLAAKMVVAWNDTNHRRPLAQDVIQLMVDFALSVFPTPIKLTEIHNSPILNEILDRITPEEQAECDRKMMDKIATQDTFNQLWAKAIQYLKDTDTTGWYRDNAGMLGEDAARMAQFHLTNLPAPAKVPTDFKIITLCGSTKFKEQFISEQKRLTLAGNIVISVGIFGHSGDAEVWNEGTKSMLDEMHKLKIDLADEIFVINTNGYIGESTKREIEYAKKTGKPIEYLVKADA